MLAFLVAVLALLVAIVSARRSAVRHAGTGLSTPFVEVPRRSVELPARLGPGAT